MPYLHLDLPSTYPVQVKRELATRLCKLYAEVMETQLWRPNVGIAELGKDNLYHLGPEGLEPITMVMVEFRRGRPAEKRLALGRAIVDICVELLDLPRQTVMVEFTPHTGEEMLRDGNWTADWTPAEAVRVEAHKGKEDE
jgi:phenylpyruvate tautomerase PptA (4-oxalocrotonate tautomerase family)